MGVNGLSQGDLGFASLCVPRLALDHIQRPAPSTQHVDQLLSGLLPKEPGHLRCLPAFLSWPSQGHVEALPHLHLSLEASDLPPWWLCLPTPA